jgi:HTH-type transcriptional regulator, sugar sensing transcriptional regulator
MRTNVLQTILTGLGLTENESAVYLAALSLGPTTVLKLARTTGIKRTTVYSVVDSLKQQGLMVLEIQGFKQYYAAEHPDKLDRIVDERRAKLKHALPELAALYNVRGGESFIKYYEGLEAIKSVYESLIRDIRPHQDYCIVSDIAQWVMHDQQYFTKFIERRAKLDIHTRLLLTDTPTAQEHKVYEQNYHETVKILPKNTVLSTNMVITPQKVVIHQLTSPLFAIVIENQSIIRMQKECFEIMWNAIT